MLLFEFKNYMDLKYVVIEVLLLGLYFKLVEVVVDYIVEILMFGDNCVVWVEVVIVKFVLSEVGEVIGIWCVWYW